MNLCMRFGNFLCRKLDRDLLLIWCDRLHMFVRKYKTKNYIIHPKLRFKKVCFDFWLLFLVFKNVRKGYRFNSSVKSLIFSTKKTSRHRDLNLIIDLKTFTACNFWEFGGKLDCLLKICFLSLLSIDSKFEVFENLENVTLSTGHEGH